jgi:hypothetical protein
MKKMFLTKLLPEVAAVWTTIYRTNFIVNARKAINDVENGQEVFNKDGEASLRLFEASKALATHVKKEHAFDKVNNMGPVGIETYQSEAFIEVIKNTNKALQEVENGLKVSE